MKEKVGEVYKLKLKRAYGPYLDNRPDLPEGMVLFGVVTGCTDFRFPHYTTQVKDHSGKKWSYCFGHDEVIQLEQIPGMVDFRSFYQRS